MQPLRTRLLCRASNRFTPSIAWWQHAGAYHPSSYRLRYTSTAAEAVLESHSHHASAPDPDPIAASELDIALGTTAIPTTTIPTKQANEHNGFVIRRLEISKGKIPKSTASIRNQSKSEASNPAAELLSSTRVDFDKAIDYKGVVVKPVVNPVPVKESQLPWCLSLEERNIPGIERLAIEITRFGEYAAPNRFEGIARKHVIEQVRNHVHQALPKYSLEVFGSERTGTALATSDIDFRLIIPVRQKDAMSKKLPPDPQHRQQAVNRLRTLQRKAFERNRMYMMPTLRHARYPLISMQDRESSIDIQIVLSNDTSMQRELMSGYMDEYPYLQQLFFAVKTIFDIRGLSDVFRGGFGSYSLFMMLVASLRHNPHPRNDAAGGFINFLQFWCDFDTMRHGVSIEPISLFDKASHPVMTDTVKSKLKRGKSPLLPAYMLSLQDPADETNDLGRKGIAIKHVQATFRALSEQLAFDMERNTRPSLLAPSVGAYYMHYRSRRARLEGYGRRVAEIVKLSHKANANAKAIQEVGVEANQNEANIKQAEEVEKQAPAQEERGREEQKSEVEEKEEEGGKLGALEDSEPLAGILIMPSIPEETHRKDHIIPEPLKAIIYMPPQEASESKSA